MDASRMIRAAGAWGHLLLVVLALGVFAMHTTGHPDSGSAMSHPAVAAPQAAPGSAVTTTAGRPGIDTANAHTVLAAGPGTATAYAPGAAVAYGDGTETAGADASYAPGAAPDPRTAAGTGAAHDSGMAMDMTSLCVAVLATWILAALLRAAIGRRPEWPAALRAAALAALRPNPPPPRQNLLATLSILRI
ncbi:hypothetical protein [Streptomyces sp. NPDC020141]|uniref:hypothetical protein n=1 Tax=Streptomyces sp. NPDC020141 TaxID=3365065 RepID=UPI0037A2C9B8